LREDWNHTGTSSSGSSEDKNTYWESVVKQSGKTIVGDNESYQTVAASKANVSSGDSSSLPEAFQSDGGKKHLTAVTSLLGLSNQRAVQVTMGALRSVDTAGEPAPGTGATSATNKDSSNDNFSSLLGTRELLAKTVAYHHKQRSARLSVLAECLRLEQDITSPIQAVTTQTLLDPLDASIESTTRKNKRGLFKNLLVVACIPDPTPKREDLEPANSLTGSYSTINNRRNNSVTSAQFGVDLFAELVAQKTRERTQAMEGLLALLYQRIDGGIHRQDFSILVTAFFNDSSLSGHTSSRDARWHQLAGLVCAECMALWRAFESPEVESVGKRGAPISYESWTKSHPLIEGFGSVDTIKGLQGLAYLLVEFDGSNQSNEPSVSLALLSFGLLLCLANDNQKDVSGSAPELPLWGGNKSKKILRDIGEKLVNSANDKGGAFECLKNVIASLTRDALSDPSVLVDHAVLYDWQLTPGRRNQVLMLGAPVNPAESTAEVTRNMISADIVAYTSIAREILAASISSFSENLLAIDRTNSCENIGLLCQLVAVVFRNNEPLCKQYWESWEAYLSSNNETRNRFSRNVTMLPSEFPICRLMDASYNLSREYLSQFINGQIPREEFLAATAPFFQLLSVLCHTSALVETMIEMLPPDMIRTALQYCVTDQRASSDTNALENVILVLESIEGLTKIASSSKTCIAVMRRSLESSSGMSTETYEGPVLLMSLFNSTTDSKITQNVLGTIANLLVGAPKEWAIPMAQQFIDQTGGIGDSATSRLVPYIWTHEEPLSHSAILVLKELIGHMGQVSFSDSQRGVANGYIMTLSFLQSLGAGLLTSMTSLATTRISTASVETADIVFRSLSNFMKGLRPIINLHSSHMIRDGATKLRESLIHTLATSNGLGEVLVYFATAPVSLGLVLKMEEMILDQAIAEEVAKDEDSEATKKYGAWYSLSSAYKGHSSGANLSKFKTLEFLSKMTSEDFDLPAIRARGWITGSNLDGVAILDASRSAIRLLSEWAASVEDMAKSHLGEGVVPSEFPLSGEAKDVVTNFSPQRLLCTLAPMPIQCHADARMSALWQSLGVSTFDLLLPYMHIQKAKEDKSRNEDSILALPDMLNFLNACLVHLRLTTPKGGLAASMLLRTIVQSTRFSSLLKDIIELGIELTGVEGNSKVLAENNQGYHKSTFLCLQILSFCVASAPVVAHAILGLGGDNSGLLGKLVEGAQYANRVLDFTGSGNIFATDGCILQVRIASGCLNVLSTFWNTTRILSKGKATDTTESNLRKEMDRQSSSFILELGKFVTNYANSNNLEDRIAISNATELGRVSAMSYVTSALEILANSHVYESFKENPNTAATLGILTGFSKSTRLLQSNTYALAVMSTKDILEIGRNLRLQDQSVVSLLSSFPALASNIQPDDFYRRENAFDTYSLARWLTCIRNVGDDDSNEDFEIIYNAVEKASLLQHLTTAQLHVMKSWKKFQEIVVFKVHYSNDGVITGPNLDILKNLTIDTLYILQDNLSGGASAQTEFSTPFMSQEICAMSNCLGDLLLFQLEIGAFDRFPLEELLNIARALATATGSLQDVACPTVIEEPAHRDLVRNYCKHQQTLLSCVIVVCGLIEKCENSRPDLGEQGDIYQSLCLMHCKFIQAFSRICNQENICEKANTTMIRSCACLLTLLVIGYQGDKSSTASYSSMLSNSFHEYEVLTLLMQYATFLSTSVANNISSSTNSDLSVEDREILDVIEAVFNLLHAIADTNDPEMIKNLHGIELSQLAVRNPLFNLRKDTWSLQDLNRAQPRRGYVFNREVVTMSNQTSSLTVSEDPVHEIWLSSMQVMGACVRTSSHYLNQEGQDSIGARFLDMSIEFLRVYEEPLLVCLASCVKPSKMTRFALDEAKILVSLIAELSKRNVRTSFVNSNIDLCQKFLEYSKIALVGLGNFLAAVGTSCELFAALDEYASTDQDCYEDLTMPPIGQLRRSLLSSIGIPTATQKAMRLSNYAAGRLEQISQEDFEAATIVPDHLKALAQKRTHQSKSEQICRDTVTNRFSGDLVRSSAKFVCQALSLVLRTHAISKSFYMFPDADRSIDSMNLVQPGIVIGYRPNIGQSMLVDSSNYECLRFGRVVKIDTFARTWEVQVIREEGNDFDILDGRKEIVQASQLAGMEDKSTRTPSTSLLTSAPESMDDFESAPTYLSTGHYILILRWCHQQSSLLQSTPSYIQQIAEQACVLLGADLVLHGLKGSFVNKDKKELLKLDDQIFELFADKAHLTANLENEEQQQQYQTSSSLVEGRLKEIIDASVWEGLQSQVRPFVQRAWKVRKEIERQRREKRMNSGDAFFSGSRRNGKSAFRR